MSDTPEYPPPIPEPAPGGLEDGACPDFDDHIVALVYRLQARLDQHLGDFKDWRAGNTADQATLRSLLEAHAREFAAWRPLIQNRVNVITALLLSVGLFALAGPEGLRRIGDAVTRGGTLGVDGIVTLVGAAIPLLYPLGRLIFLRPWAKRSVRTARDGPPET